MADADMAEDEASFDTEERVMMSRTEFDYLHEQLDDLRFEVSDYAQEFERTMRRLRDYCATFLHGCSDRMPMILMLSCHFIFWFMVVFSPYDIVVGF
ncbi:hypothetical protein SLA2020_263030 [Shorea laevis]